MDKSDQDTSVKVAVRYLSGSYFLFPAGALRAPAGPKIVLVPLRSIYIYIYIHVCLHLKIIMPFIHVVLEECTP